ncbi:hypothetical protein F5B21DRAFT_469899 [Xylaria acuta]|nr:hypothetical protein F5B21DRAFT_469899 [Xylaria acuta]
MRFIYESRPGQRFVAEPVHRGRCNIPTDLSREETRTANNSPGFGADESQLPYSAEGNGHNWIAGVVAVTRLEAVGARWSDHGGNISNAQPLSNASNFKQRMEQLQWWPSIVAPACLS